MAKKLTTLEKVHRAFLQLGVELNAPDEEGFVRFKYENHNCLLVTIEEDEIYFFTCLVVGVNGLLPKEIFDTALELTQRHYEGVTGEWTPSYAFINSPWYTLKGRRNLPKTMLRVTLDKFFEMYLFMEYCILLMMDDEEDDSIDAKEPDNEDAKIY